jgi:hypothetical protein
VPLQKVVDRIPDETITFDDRNDTFTVQDVQEELLDQMDLFFRHAVGDLDLDDLKEDVDTYASWMLAMDLFSNDAKQLPDGAAQYGIVLHSHGDATKDFGAASGNSTNATLENIIIHDLQLSVREFVGYRPSDDLSSFITATYGDAIDMKTAVYNILDEDYSERVDELKFQGNALLDAQIVLGKFCESTECGNTMSMASDGDFMLWATEGEPLGGKLSCNQDAMRHLNKGIIGLRIEETIGVNLKNIDISYLNNWSTKGTLVCGSYTGPDNGGHEAMTHWDGYQGADARGISVFGSTDVNIEDVTVSFINSVTGHATGIDLIDSSEIEIFSDVLITTIRAGITVTNRELEDFSENEDPNAIPVACGVKDSGTNTVSGIEFVSSSDIEGYLTC